MQSWEDSGLIQRLELDEKLVLINVFEKARELIVGESSQESSQELSKRLNLNKELLEITNTIIFPIIRRIYSFIKNKRYDQKWIEEVMDSLNIEDLIVQTTNSICILASPIKKSFKFLDCEAELVYLISKNYANILWNLYAKE